MEDKQIRDIRRVVKGASIVGYAMGAVCSFWLTAVLYSSFVGGKLEMDFWVALFGVGLGLVQGWIFSKMTVRRIPKDEH